jgi:hypothetical protein
MDFSIPESLPSVLAAVREVLECEVYQKGMWSVPGNQRPPSARRPIAKAMLGR